MNILVVTPQNRVVVRPDTTWVRLNNDFYPPEFVNSLSFTRVLYVRICKPGRSVGRRFAERYYDLFGRGILLYPDDLLLDGSPEGFACASCLDHTSYLPCEMAPKSGLSPEDAARVCSAIELATRFCYIRVGDLLAIELGPPEHLRSREEGSTKVHEEQAEFGLIF